ncbi:complement receptor type 1-like [Erythrolamprus reginae]|uniref:complement receptor type 1-like n=1 Tax=Erythrolamprus reginae TaxID=121349 RepID=UPI00396CB4D0
MISACTLSLLFAATFLAAALGNQDRCGYPPRLNYAELMDEYKEKDTFPVGSTVKYKCRPGYMKKPGMYSSSCTLNQKWSKVQELCKGRSCGHPGEPEGGRLLVTGDFTLGSTANYQCDEGYRVIGTTTRVCKVRNNKMEWSDEVPHCEIIPCSTPPNIPHGKHNGQYSQYFDYGTVVTYTCDKGYPLIGNASIFCTSKDGLNGEWSGRAYCGVTPCPSPHIKNGRIVAGISSTYKYNQKVSFECIEGHKMVGSREIHCQGDGTWDPLAPICVQVVQCPPPPDIQNGTRSNQETGVFPRGIFVKYTCNPGYALIGDATIQCMDNGRWSSLASNCEVVQCLPPPDIENGTRSNQETTVFSSRMYVKYTCNPGYALIGEATIQCLDNGMWSSPAPNCEGGNCDVPIKLDFAELYDVYQKMNSFSVGSLVKYKCNPGYFKYPRMNASSICIRNQVWSEVQEFCKKKSCGHPGEPENGRLIVSGDFLFGSTLHFTCEEGYKMIGQSSRQCVLNGKTVKWSGSLPECQPILCSSPPDIPHGMHTGKYLTRFFYGTTVTYRCDKGYPLFGNVSISCTSKDGINGEWSGRAYCGATQCLSPTIKNGRIVAGVSSTYKYNQKVSFECIGDHKMVGSREIHCQVDGTWDPPTPICEHVVQCPSPPDIKNGTRSNQETGVFPSGIFVKYTCNPGYDLIGETTLYCTNAGKWSSPAPNCEGKACEHPGEPEGARLLVTGDFRFGSTVNYQCEEGYRLIGKSSRSCALFGKTVAWTGDPPYCQKTQCPYPQIKNGRIAAGISSDFKYKQKVSLECVGGHKMVGSSEIYCQEDGRWDPPIPVCEQVLQCQPPPDIQNGIHSNQETLFPSGMLVKYTCNHGYALIGDATIQCMDNGTWSSPAPNCEEIECKSPPVIQNGDHSNQEVMVFRRGMCVKYTCNFGYTLVGDATIHCTDSGMWTLPAPHCEKSQCPFPPSIANGKHDGLALKMFTSEMSVTYSCDPGYLLIGKASIFCGPSGNWSLPVPSCEVMLCPAPPNIIHGKRVGEDFTYGKSIIYICDAGYSCIGNYSVTCIWNSSNSVKWSETPRCQGCLAPPNIAHSKRDKTILEDFPYGTSVTYHCDPGFFLIGAPTIYCQTTGTWNQPVPQCKRREYTEATKLARDSQMTKDGNNEIEEVTGSFVKNTIHSKINKTTAKDLATTLTPLIFGGEPNIQRLREQLNVGTKTDQLNGGNETDQLNGGNETDQLNGGNETDQLNVGTETDQLNVGTETDQLNGGNETDQLNGGNETDQLNGGTETDQLNGGNETDQLNGGNETDQLNGGNETDQLNVGNETDQLNGGTETDQLNGGTETDQLNGGNETDQLNGGTQTDQLNGGTETDQLNGGTETDQLNGGTETDQLNGGNETDQLNGGNETDQLNGGTETDQLNGGNETDQLNGGTETDQLNGGNETDQLNGGNETDQLNGGNETDQLNGGNETDQLNGGTETDQLNGGTETDQLNGGTETDQLNGGNETDQLNGGTETDQLNGGTETDQLNGGNETDQLNGGNETDQLNGGTETDQLNGGNETDQLNGGNETDQLNGGNETDQLNGGNQTDQLNGGNQTDQLNGGNQTDQLNGGNQTDAFPEVRNCSGEVDGCPVPPLSGTTKTEATNVIQSNAKVPLECENGYVRNDSSPIQAQQIGRDVSVPACTLGKKSSYNFATIGFGSVGSILLLLFILGGVMWIVLLQKRKRNCTCEAQRRYCVASYEDSPL